MWIVLFEWYANESLKFVMKRDYDFFNVWFLDFYLPLTAIRIEY